MTTPQLEPLKLARQGNEQAIAFLINRSLISRGITAKTVLKDGCLQVMLEAAQIPDKQTLAPFIYRGVKGLGVGSIQKLRVYGRQAGETRPAWSQEFELLEPSKTSANKLDEQTEQLNKMQSASPINSSSYNKSKNEKFAGKDKISPVETAAIGQSCLGCLTFIVLIIGGLYIVGLFTGSNQPNTSNRRTISSSDFQGNWMLTVDKGELVCKDPKNSVNSIVFIAPDGTEYAVNGIAKGKGYAAIQPIWKDNSENPGTKIDISPLIDEGLKLCK